ncbi:hypothetical protein NDU88_011681 [Pleurodeles waltl]|uniref:Uncharacterized protein n=1 Tax=Pleurodeles waltl TaxID=8319 RepID=A0AAV7QY12_PLEWA|nr:hypothetical protein NDU88_011681 [Pleurodeles waltl]
MRKDLEALMVNCLKKRKHNEVSFEKKGILCDAETKGVRSGNHERQFYTANDRSSDENDASDQTSNVDEYVLDLSYDENIDEEFGNLLEENSKACKTLKDLMGENPFDPRDVRHPRGKELWPLDHVGVIEITVETRAVSIPKEEDLEDIVPAKDEDSLPIQTRDRSKMINNQSCGSLSLGLFRIMHLIHFDQMCPQDTDKRDTKTILIRIVKNKLGNIHYLLSAKNNIVLEKRE